MYAMPRPRRPIHRVNLTLDQAQFELLQAFAKELGKPPATPAGQIVLDVLGAAEQTPDGRFNPTGVSVARRDRSVIDQLTPQELQIARLGAQGLSNREIAGQLFLSPRTVGFHLSHAFAKLGIASRAELRRFELAGEPLS